MKEDWLMDQFKNVGKSIGMLMKKELQTIELGEEQVAKEQTRKRTDILLSLLEKNDFEGAFLLVDGLRYKLSYYDYHALTEWFISYLEKEGNQLIASEQVETYKKELSKLF